MPPIEFKAPWSRSLRLRTLALSMCLALVAVVGVVFSFPQSRVGQLALIVLPLTLLVLAILTAVRGYSLSDRQLIVRCMSGRTLFALRDIRSIEGNAEAMNDSICLFANCGLFSFRGWYFNRRLKLYRSLVSDPSRAVVLRFDRLVVVVSPHDPQQFIVRARTFMKTAGFEDRD